MNQNNNNQKIKFVSSQSELLFPWRGRNYAVLFLPLVFLFTIFTVGCGEKRIPERFQKQMQEKNDSLLIIGMLGDPRDLNPISYQERYSELLSSLIHAAPLKRDSTGSFTPDLWESFTFGNDPSGNLIVEGTWKENIKWHDGAAFSKKDFEFTLNAMKRPEAKSYYRDLAEKIINVEQSENDRKCRITFKGSSRQYFELLCAGILPEHILKEQNLDEPLVKIVEEKDASGTLKEILPYVASETSEEKHRFCDYPIGLGPYKIESRIPGQIIELVKIDIPQKSSKAAFEKIMVRFYSDIEEEVNDLRKGKLDAAFFLSDYYQVLKEIKFNGVKLVKLPNPSYLMLGYNTKKTPFDNVNVRKAFDHALNRKRIAEIISLPGEPLFDAPIFSTSSSSNDLKDELFDPGKCSEALAKEGLVDVDADGWREFQGKKLELDFLVNGDNFVRKSVGEEIVEELKHVGIKVKLKTPDWPEVIKSDLPEGKYDLFLLAFYAPSNGNWMNLWHSTPKVGDGLNFTNFFSPELDEAFLKLDGLISSSEENELKLKAKKIFDENLPASFLFKPCDSILISDRLTIGGEEIPEQVLNPLNWKLGPSSATTVLPTGKTN
ncbi:MAG: hypothetical protein HQM08_03210 [Candidatus Riflebacteria bacterium]|nr:hypothetical protein [Candidatus Riflebacteria bacterium]